MRFISIIVATLILTGCGLSNVRHAAVVDPVGIQSYAAVCSVEVPGLTPEGYVFAGWDFVDEQCGTFFDNVILLQKDTRYASSAIATANTQTALILAAVEASAKSIAIVAASSEFVRRLIDNFATEYAFAPYAVEVRQLVIDALMDYRVNADTMGAIAAMDSSRTIGDAQCLANNIVRNYAKICTISGVEALARQAIANSQVGPSSDPNTRARRGGRGRSLAILPRSTAAERASFRGSLALPNYVAGAPR